MEGALYLFGQVVTLLLIALALGMDAFSLGIGIGMGGIRLRRIIAISTLIGVFHIIMPLTGIVIGIYLSDMVGDIAVLIGGGILVILGVHMLWSAFFGETETSLINTTGLGILLISFSVSLDALSVGFSLGLMAVNKWLAVSLFGVIGGLMAGSGLLLGRSVGSWLGNYSGIFGGVILLIFGLQFIL
ncbi:manganese efflux pump MntP [Brevibacillus daliensis]|uniref:manganese efflux pump MntP n=1 Tax=Brevibacillus daliensis TaxID=2892995 RepID=UPI001E562627|nr:manganese efflux pump [Brevibacillus daliensis]